jgi:transcriptional regulator with XRE-family HTH domain
MKAGLTQSQLAARLGVKQSTVAMWETGGNTPRAGSLIKMSEILGCSIDDLVGKKPTKAKPKKTKSA